MKKLILSSVVVLFMNTTFANVRVPDPIVKFSNVDKEISQLLNSYPHFEELDNDLQVRINIKVNDNNEIEVLRVIPVNVAIEKFIKFKLNHKKLVSKELKVGEEYSFPVTFRVN